MTDEMVECTIAATEDVSPRVQELMRRIDRLPAGTYELTIVKPEIRAVAWVIEITRLEKIETFRLSKYLPE